MKITSIILIILLLSFGIIPDFGMAAIQAEGQSLKLGDYVQFGAYNNQPILWRIINKNKDGSLMLFSEYILCMRAFDANGDSTDGRDSKDRSRVRRGSNNWEKSNMREWLNSKDTVVKYSHQKPDKNHVEDFSNDDPQAGFLSYFTEMERNAIQPCTHKIILSGVDKAVKAGGTEYHKESSQIANVVQNYDTSYYKNLTDNVFLLDIKELHDYVYKRGWETKRECNPKGIFTAEDSVMADFTGYWLRTPTGDIGDAVRDVCGDIVRSLLAFKRNVGVVPALNLKANTQISGGDGSKDKPYVLNTAPKYIELKLGSTSLNLQKGNIGTIISDVEPSNARIKYSSSNPDVASVSSDGTVKGINQGTAVITVSASNTGYINKVQKVYVTVVPDSVSYIDYDVSAEVSGGSFTIWDGNRFMTINGYNSYVSQNGINWDKAGLLYPGQSENYQEVQKEPWLYIYDLWYGLAYGNNTYLALSHSESSLMRGKVLWSKDGITWNQSLVGKLGSGNVAFLGVKYINKSFYVFGYSANNKDKQYNDKLIIYKSLDGVNWKTYVQTFPGGYDAVAFNGKTYVLGSHYREIAVSGDGTKWTIIDLGKSIKFKGTGGTGLIKGLASKGDNFVLTTYQGEILTSKDGKKWSKTADMNLNFEGMEWTGRQYIAPAYDNENNEGSIFVSKDGSKWSQIKLGKNIHPKDIYWNSKEIFISCNSVIVKVSQDIKF